MDLLYPDYSKDNIYTLACGISSFLGVERNCISKMEVHGKRIALVLLDGLGWSTLSKVGIPKEARKITTVFPSTTSTVITTLFTAMTPGEHGVLGYNTFVKRMGGIINTLRFTHPSVNQRDSFKDSISFDKVFPNVKGYLKEVDRNSKKTLEIVPKGLDGNEFSKATHENTTETKTFSNLWDALYIFSDALQRDYEFVYLYIPDVDTMSHKYGPYAEPTLSTAKAVFESIYNVAKIYQDRFSTFITADHGHVTVSDSVIIMDDKNLMEMLDIPPYGDSRALFMRTRYELLPYFAEKYSSIKVFSKQEVTDGGLLGKVNDLSLVPDYIGIPTDYKSYIFDYKENGDYAKLKGHHGGLLPEEFEIPLVVLGE
ncbi:alkaline phosphatase family protein [Sulfuracidifex metallicus]|uniref:alkaline phosphatase family protein n=1 Tax=Sulfuracidifex metallicus TaxID=47303 RepID=UPI002275A5D4|nr:alkaline phosphatase family protein [Sulfuracidifex metallicus]MCY0850428.1 alkaline phosphatase family protein [Sulfuracidifex metallicus]